MTEIFIIVAAIAFLLTLIFIKILSNDDNNDIFSSQKTAGKKGEMLASDMIASILDDDEILFTNVQLIYDSQKTEIDNIVINKNGLFIIETKTLNGWLEGDEDTWEWKQYRVSNGGNNYVKTIRNPVSQVKRQIYLLKKYLSSFGIYIWIDGYVFLLNENDCSVSSEYLLFNIHDIDRAIHKTGKNKLTPSMIHSIQKALTDI